MSRYAVYQYDGSMFVVFDQNEKREICICGEYEGGMDAKARAFHLCALLNHKPVRPLKPNRFFVRRDREGLPSS
jgi:hypothetical protein